MWSISELVSAGIGARSKKIAYVIFRTLHSIELLTMTKNSPSFDQEDKIRSGRRPLTRTRPKKNTALQQQSQKIERPKNSQNYL